MMAAHTIFNRETAMVICPIAIVAGCEKCPAFKVCPLKGVIGDQKKDAEPEGKAQKKAASGGKKKG